jgi:hypothetical protein
VLRWRQRLVRFVEQVLQCLLRRPYIGEAAVGHLGAVGCHGSLDPLEQRAVARLQRRLHRLEAIKIS